MENRGKLNHKMKMHKEERTKTTQSFKKNTPKTTPTRSGGSSTLLDKVDFFASIFSGQSSEEEGPLEDTRTIPNFDFDAEHRADKHHNPEGNFRKKNNERETLISAVKDCEEDEETTVKDVEFDDDSEVEIVGVGIKGDVLPPTTIMLQIDKTEIPVEEESGNVSTGDEVEENVDDMEHDSEVTQRTALRKELSNLTFEELEALKDKMGLALYNEAMFGKSSRKLLSKNKQTQLFRRDNKNRPREMSSKVRVPKVREVLHVKKVVKRDPRFEDSCGELNKEIWNKNYDFLNEIQQMEVEQLKKSVKNEPDKERQKEIRKYIQSYKNKEKSKLQKDKEIQQRKAAKEENVKRMAEGKNPFYMKKSTKKLLELADKYEQLKSSGKLDNYVKKKRKKNLTRDKKTILKQ